jgi:hypothetical protein
MLLLLVLTGASSWATMTLKPTPVRSMFVGNLHAPSWGMGASDDWNQPAKTDQDKMTKTLATEKKGHKSAFRAALYSALLPGMGQYYVDHKTRAKVFLSAEAVAWIGFASFRTYGGWRKDDMIKFAADQAGADVRGRGDWYEDMVGFYRDVNQYNTRGRVDDVDRDRPYYSEGSGYTWNWKSTRDQTTYRTLKNRYREAYRRADFMVGLMVINRIVSILDAVRGATRYMRQVDASFGGEMDIRVHLAVNPWSGHEPVKLTVYKRF